MAVPPKAKIKVALLELELVADRREFRVKDIIEPLAIHFDLTDEDRIEPAAGGSKRFPTRCNFACFDLKDEGLLERTRRGYYRITADGLEAVQKTSGLTNQTGLDQGRNSKGTSANYPPTQIDYVPSVEDNQTTEDSIEDNYQEIRKQLAQELLKQIKENSPRYFENLVIDLLVKMGYGDSREDAEAVGGSGDGGIDGVIKNDRLGLDVIYVQAKRWEHSVGEQPVRDFVGALHGRRARKGIFITTSDFARSTREYIKTIDPQIILIDGHQLVEYMIDHDVGVSTVKTYEIKRVDSDYFLETDDSQTQNS